MNNPIRTCVACKQKFNQKELSRVVRTSNNDYFLDVKHKMFGRSAYFCNNEKCIEKICKNKILNKVYKTNINQELYNELTMLLK